MRLKGHDLNRIIAFFFGVVIVCVEVVAAFDVYESSLWTVERVGLAIAKTIGLALLFVITLVAQTARPRGKARILTVTSAILLFFFIFIANMLINYHHNRIPDSVYSFFSAIKVEHINRVWAVLEAGVRQIVTAICWLVFGLLWAGEAFGEPLRESQNVTESVTEEEPIKFEQKPVRVKMLNKQGDAWQTDDLYAEDPNWYRVPSIVHSDNHWPSMPEGTTRTGQVRQLLKESPDLLGKRPKEFAEHYGKDYYHIFAKARSEARRDG